MANYLEILRLDSLNHSQRTIESTVHCSRHTVRSVLQAAKEKQITWPLDDDITNTELEEILFPGKYKSLFIISACADWRADIKQALRAGAGMRSRTTHTSTGSWRSRE
ncbi:MAG: hypothetical protein HFF17_13980 [Oscillospiraceae bacterium]|nr:hypothetical protein [Oscillospiraceae bacterium]